MQTQSSPDHIDGRAATADRMPLTDIRTPAEHLRTGGHGR